MRVTTKDEETTHLKLIRKSNKWNIFACCQCRKIKPYFSLKNRSELAITGFFWRKLQRWM